MRLFQLKAASNGRGPTPKNKNMNTLKPKFSPCSTPSRLLVQIPLLLAISGAASAATIKIAGTAGAAGGDFADYSGLAANDPWADSSVNDGTVSLRASLDSLDSSTSAAVWSTSSYSGAGSEINFQKGGATDASSAVAGNHYLNLIVDSTGFGSSTITIDSITVSVWRNGAQAAENYQLAYDSAGDGYGTDDLLGTAVNNTTSGSGNTFTIGFDPGSAITSAGTEKEIRLYFWRPSGGAANANTHLFEVSAEYSVVPEPSSLLLCGLASVFLIGRRRRGQERAY